MNVLTFYCSCGSEIKASREEQGEMVVCPSCKMSGKIPMPSKNKVTMTDFLSSLPAWLVIMGVILWFVIFPVLWFIYGDGILGWSQRHLPMEFLGDLTTILITGILGAGFTFVIRRCDEEKKAAWWGFGIFSLLALMRITGSIH